MDTLIPKLYKEYGIYTNSNRAFPNEIDGLKPVERRVLLSSYNVARDKFVKSARIDGETLGHFHPHSSSYGTIVQMVNQGFLDGQGSFGSNIGIEPSPPAAMRYTECKLTKKTFDMTFKLINHVDWVESELDDEPEFLPTMFPFCLMGKEYTTGIGFGFKTLIPCYKVDDLKNRLLYLIGEKKEKPTIKPISECNILSNDEELEKLLTTGKATIVYQGIHKIDNVKCKAIIKSFPPGKRFQKILDKFEKELNNLDIGWRDESSRENGGTHIVFEVLKSRNRNEIFKAFTKKFIDVLTSTVSFEIILVDNKTKNVKNMSVDEMLVNTFKQYLSINMRMLKSNEEKINNSIEEVKLLEKITPFLLKYIKNKELDKNIIIEKISEDSKEDKDKVKELLQKHSIIKLLSFKPDFDDLNEKLKVVKDDINNIGKFVIDQYEKI